MIIDFILKEWSSAFEFFELKKYGLIFRKGGIHEKDFKLKDNYFGIFKTYEHESKETLKDKYSYLLKGFETKYTGSFDLEYVCKIKESFVINKISFFDEIDEYHPWDKEYLIDRFNFRKTNDLVAYFLDIEKLKIPKKANYEIDKAKGCKSWFDLKDPVNTFATINLNDKMNENKVLNKFTNL
jgi:hypothetical protein